MAFLSGIWGKLLSGLAIIFGILAILLRQEYLGRMAERGRAQAKVLQAARTRQEVEDQLKLVGPGAVESYLTHPARR